MFAVLALALCLGTGAALLWPILRPRGGAGGPSARRVYEDQLAEVDRDAARGLLGPDEARAARVEVERRLLDAARRHHSDAPGVSRSGRLVFAGLAALTPLLAGALYLALGNPELVSAPPAPPASQAALADAPTVETLAARLRADPDDADGWAQLARLLANEGRAAEALPAYAQAVRLTDGRDLLLLGEQAEQTVIAANRRVTPEARDAFARILAAEPGDARAATYLAIYDAQAGDLPAATARLRALLGSAPGDAPWRPRVEDLLARMEASLVQSAQIEAMVSGLADRLAENPDDVEGWRRLAVSYGVLDRQAEAEAAWREVLRLRPGDEEALTALGEE